MLGKVVGDRAVGRVMSLVSPPHPPQDQPLLPTDIVSNDQACQPMVIVNCEVSLLILLLPGCRFLLKDGERISLVFVCYFT